LSRRELSSQLERFTQRVQVVAVWLRDGQRNGKRLLSMGST
jgi:hypothetical protein